MKSVLMAAPLLSQTAAKNFCQPLINTDEHRLPVFCTIRPFLKLRMIVGRHIIFLLVDNMTRTLLFPLTIPDWYTTRNLLLSLMI